MFRDDRASQKRCVVAKLAGTGPNTAPLPVFSSSPNLPMGDYVITAYLEAVPVETLHTLNVTIKAGDTERHAGAVEFDPAGGYQPFAIRVFHPGGRLSIQVDARGATGFEGMRKGSSDREKDVAGQVKSADAGRLLTDEKAKTEVDSLDLDEGGELKALPRSSRESFAIELKFAR